MEPHTLVTAERVVATAGRANPDALREQLGLPQGLEKMSKRDMVALARSLGREASATESLAALRGKLVDGSLALQVGAGVEERQRLPRAETAPASGSRSRPKRDTSLPFSNSMWTQVQSPLMAPGATLLLLNTVTVGKDEQFEEFEKSVRRRWVVEQGVDGWRENHKAHAAASASTSAGAAEQAHHGAAAAAEAPSGPSSPPATKPGPQTQLHSMVLDMKVEKGHREQLKGKDRDPAKGDQFRGGSKKAHRMGGGMWTTMTSSSRWRLARARPGRGGKKKANAEKAPQEKVVRLKVKFDGNAAVSPSPSPSAASDGLAGQLAGVEIGAEPLPADPLHGRAPASRRPHTTPHLTRHHHPQHRHGPAGVGALGNESSRGGGFGPAKRGERAEVSASTSAPATNLAAAAAGPTAAAAGGAGGAQRLHIDAKGNIHHVVYVGVPQLPAAAATVPARASFKLNPSAQHGGVGAGALTAEIFATHYLSSPPMY